MLKSSPSTLHLPATARMITTADPYDKAFHYYVERKRDVKCSANVDSVNYAFIHTSTYTLVTFLQADYITVTRYSGEEVFPLLRITKLVAEVGYDSLS